MRSGLTTVYKIGFSDNFISILTGLTIGDEGSSNSCFSSLN